jgi:pimeloyl-ACP methyl ester carboxylesterase
MKTLPIALVAIAATLAAPLTLAEPAPSSSQSEPLKRGHVATNGLSYYYELHGRGEPLLLLHGGLGSIEMFGAVLPMLAQHRQVIAVDLQGHGRTAIGERPINPEDIGNDMAAIVKQLGHSQVEVLGDSFGGTVAFRFAAQHPTLVRRLVLVSTLYARDGFFPEMLPQQAAVSGAMAEGMKETPMYKTYAAIAPRPQDFPKLLDQMGDFMRGSYDWTADVAKLTMPVMLVYGDSDMIRPEHMVKFYQLLGGGLKDAGWRRENMSRNRLAILPNLTHYEIFAAPELAQTVLPFLGTAGGASTGGSKGWSEQTQL